MTERHDLATKFAVFRVVSDRLKDAKAAADCEIRDTWKPGDRNAATLPDGTVVASVTLAKGSVRARLVDEPAFEAWVASTHPDQVETVTITRVRPEFREQVMSAARKLGFAIDVVTGVPGVPGVQVDEGDPHPTTRLDKAAPEAIAGAWQSGDLAELVGGLLRPAIEGGDA